MSPSVTVRNDVYKRPRHLPCSFLPSPPPYQPNACSILLFAQYALRIRQEAGLAGSGGFAGGVGTPHHRLRHRVSSALIRKVPAPFITHQETIVYLVAQCTRGLLQSWAYATEDATTTRVILRARGYAKFLRELVACRSCTASDVR